MPFVGLGLHVLIAIFFAVHAVRNGRELYWLIILFSFPMLGSIVYFLVIYLPSSRLERGAQRAVRAAVKVLDPTKELREARLALELSPTAQNQIRLAQALLANGQYLEAATQFESCLKGPFAADPDIRWRSAQARLANGQAGLALQHLHEIRREHPAFRPDEVMLCTAKALAEQGDAAAARTAFEEALHRFDTFEIRAEYAIWCYTAGGERELHTAARLHNEMTKAMKRWNRHTRQLNAPVVRRLQAAQQAAPDRA